MDEDGFGPCERAWRAHFATADAAQQRRARLVMAEDELPVVVVPSWYGPEQREAVFALALANRYLRLFGLAALIWAVGLQERLPEALAALGPGEEQPAAD